MTKHVHVSVLVVLLSLCVVLITGTQQNGNQQIARDIAEQFTEMMERRALETEGSFTFTKTCQCNIPRICKKKIIRKNDIFAHNIDNGFTLESLRRGCSNEYPQSMFPIRNNRNGIPF